MLYITSSSSFSQVTSKELTTKKYICFYPRVTRVWFCNATNYLPPSHDNLSRAPRSWSVGEEQNQLTQHCLLGSWFSPQMECFSLPLSALCVHLSECCSFHTLTRPLGPTLPYPAASALTFPVSLFSQPTRLSLTALSPLTARPKVRTASCVYKAHTYTHIHTQRSKKESYWRLQRINVTIITNLWEGWWRPGNGVCRKAS